MKPPCSQCERVATLRIRFVPLRKEEPPGPPKHSYLYFCDEHAFDHAMEWTLQPKDFESLSLEDLT